MLQGSLGLQQFRMDDCLSYVVFDRFSGQALVVDPRLEQVENYSTFIIENKLRVRWVVDTRLQVHHLSGTHLFLAALDRAQGGLVMSSRTASLRPTLKLAGGSRLALGSHFVEVLETPGASEDGLSLRGGGWILTGDALWVGGGASTDLLGAAPGLLWESVQKILTQSSGDTLIFPGHDEQEILFSTVETERHRNPVFLCSTAEAYMTQKAEERPVGLTQESRTRQRLNSEREPHVGSGEMGDASFKSRVGGFDSGLTGTPVSISVDKFRRKLEERPQATLFIDVREAGEFTQGHIPGVENISLSELGFQLPRLREARRIYVSCLSGIRSAQAVRTLTYVGLTDVVMVQGGLKAWSQAGFQLGQ